MKKRNKRLKTAIFLGVLFLAVFLCFSNNVLAQDAGEKIQEGMQAIEQPLGLSTVDIRVIIARIIRVALGLVGIVMVGMMIYAGYLWMTAGGNEEQINTAKGFIKNAVIGLAIILSAYGIVSFVINMLGIGEGDGSDQTTVSVPGENNLAMSGALGKAIKEHYPTRDQTGVPRNAKIVITFFKPVLPASFIDDTNNNKIFGDCVNLGNANFSWIQDCDRIKMENNKLSDNFINIKQTVKNEPILAAAVNVANSEANGVPGVYSISIKPITSDMLANGGYLGSDSENIQYTVHLGKEILTDDPMVSDPKEEKPLFSKSSEGSDEYEWKFTCSNQLDISAPTVLSVYPFAFSVTNKVEPKNSVIQINFSEQIDPVGIQGALVAAPGGAHYELKNGYVYLKSPNSEKPAGSFNLVNNFRTLEFTPTKSCGTNSCGGAIYCLNVCDKPGATCQEDVFSVLLKSARILSAKSFESAPFTGVADVSGNALDGDADGVPEPAPTELPDFDKWLGPDNYFWSFKVGTGIDKTSPYLIKVEPGIDAQFVGKNDPWTMEFSKPLRIESVYGIGIEEKPTPAERKDNTPLCKSPFVNNDLKLGISKVTMSHCQFLDGTKQYYYPTIPSTVEDVNFNCFYPGVGPAVNGPGTEKQSAICSPKDTNNNCCKVSPETGKEFCCNGSVSSGDNNACVNALKKISP